MENRTIKFRAWDDEDKKMYFFDLIDLRQDQEKSDMKNLYLSDNTTYVMQFTGLHDRNGKEIYEGDVLIQFAFDRSGDKDFQDEVVFLNGSFGYWVNKDKPWEKFISYAGNPHFNWINGASEQVEVIGNIYESK